MPDALGLAELSVPHLGQNIAARLPQRGRFTLLRHHRPSETNPTVVISTDKCPCDHAADSFDHMFDPAKKWLRQGTITARLSLLGCNTLCARGTHRVSRACSRNPECSYVGQILYSFSRSGMSSLATPEIVPLKPPVAAKKTGLPRASAATVSTVSVIVRTPDA